MFFFFFPAKKVERVTSTWENDSMCFFLNNSVCIAKRHGASSGTCYRLRILIFFAEQNEKKNAAGNEKLSP